jgi:hypothetical protein
MHLFILLLTLFFTTQIDAKIRILTFHYNLPELIEIQHKTLKRFLKEDYELIVFNDAREPQHERAIQETCDKFGIRCVRFKPEWHDMDLLNAKVNEWAANPNLYSHIGNIHSQHPSVRHCHVIQYALDKFGYNHNDLVALLDGDCFLTRPVSFKKLLGNNDIIGIRKEEGGYDYLWVVFTLFDPRTAPHKDDLKFHIDVINNQIHDTGSHTYHYLEDHPEVVYQKFKGEASSGFYHWSDEDMRNYGFTPNEIALLRDLDSLKGFPWPITVEFHINNQFIHLGNSSFGLPGHQEKLDCVKRFVKRILKKRDS